MCVVDIIMCMSGWHTIIATIYWYVMSAWYTLVYVCGRCVVSKCVCMWLYVCVCACVCNWSVRMCMSLVCVAGVCVRSWYVCGW